MPTGSRIAWFLAALLLASPAAFADGIEPGLWKITTRIDLAGAVSPPNISGKCLTAEEAGNPAVTFAPISRTINSECAPLERSFVDGKLSWKLACRGRFDMDLVGEFNFDSRRHYTATVRSTAAVAGRTVADSTSIIEAEWVSECR
jgi:hypothetical protein